jgi:formylglycine-generating enzyme required for sulfatase activity
LSPNFVWIHVNETSQESLKMKAVLSAKIMKVMKTKFHQLFIMLTLLAGIHQASAQETRFFRLVGPAATGITAFRPDGTLVWTNAQPGATYTVQTVQTLPGGTNWVDYIQVPTTNAVNTNLLFAFNPPAGMALVPGGSFLMGNSIGDADISGASPMNITVSPFYMDVNLVSYSQWLSVYSYATSHGYSFDHAGAGKAPNQPVQTVDWYDVVKWSNARSQQAGLTPVYYEDAGLTQIYTSGEVAPYMNLGASGYRLPTEAEWEKAARGGLIGQRFPWGNTICENQANYNGDTNYFSYDLGPNGANAIGLIGGLPYTSPAGSFAANGYGLCDMAGNVFEWCWDWYGTPYGLPTTNNPTGPATGNYRVFRGGAWNSGAGSARCADRNNDGPTGDVDIIGFRCVMGL